MVSSYLQRARDNTERISLTVKASAATSRQAFSTGAVNLPWATVDLCDHAEQLAHFENWVYVCVSAIARRIAAQPLLLADASKARGVRRGRGVKAFSDPLVPLDSHALLDAIHTPNPLMVRWSLMFATAACLKLTGVAYWWLASNDSGSAEIWPLPSSWVYPLDRWHTKYEVRPLGEGLVPFEVSGDRMARFSLPDPADPWRAISPLQSQAAAVDADESLQVAQAMSFRNGLHPTLGVIAGDITDLDNNERRPLLDDDQRNMIYDALNRVFQGPGQFARAIIFDALIRDVKPLSTKPAEMDFLNSGNATKARIFQAFGINPIIVGEIQGANRAQAVVAEQSFCDNVVNPMLELMSQVVTRWVCPVFASEGEKLEAWFEPCHAQDREMALSEWQTGLQYGAATRSQYAQRVLGVPPVPGGDVPLVPMSMVPADGQQA